MIGATTDDTIVVAVVPRRLPSFGKGDHWERLQWWTG
jgi:hypothetical protein